MLMKDGCPPKGATEGITGKTIKSCAGHPLNGMHSWQDWQLLLEEGASDSSPAGGWFLAMGQSAINMTDADESAAASCPGVNPMLPAAQTRSGKVHSRIIMITCFTVIKA
jgi:hypothetical protein